MSRVINKLEQISRGIPKPMGFTALPSAATKPRMALILSLTDLEGGENMDVSGADAVLLHPDKLPSVRALQKVARSLSDVPWGIWITENGARDLADLSPAGCDYAVFPLTGRVSATYSQNKLAKVLCVEASLGDSLLRVLNDLPIDALMVDAASSAPLTWERLLALQRFAAFRKPLLAFMDPEPGETEIKAAWAAGVDGIVIEPLPVEVAGKVAGLSKTMREMVLPPRKRGHAEALIPRIQPQPEAPPEEEEEDDD